MGEALSFVGGDESAAGLDNSPGSLKSNLPSYRQRNCNATAPFSIKPGSCRYTAIIEPFFNHVQGGELA